MLNLLRIDGEGFSNGSLRLEVSIYWLKVFALDWSWLGTFLWGLAWRGSWRWRGFLRRSAKDGTAVLIRLFWLFCHKFCYY